VVAALALLLAGCGDDRSDAVRYRDALTAEDWTSARAGCATLDGDMRDDCLVAAMDRHDVKAPTACDALAVGVWRDECLFRLAERVAADGDVAGAAAACHAMRYARECSFHLVRNAARTVLTEPVARAAPALEPWRSALHSAPDAARLFWRTYFREGMGKTAADPTACPDEDCRAGAREAVYTALQAMSRADGFCDGEAATAALGVVGQGEGRRVLWVDTPLTSAWVREWREVECNRRRDPGGRDPRRGSSEARLQP
jgi:hypothetical protein